MKKQISKIYFFLFMPFVPLKKSAPAKLFLVPTFISSFMVLLCVLIVLKIIKYKVDDTKILYMFLIFQVFFYIIFSPVIPLNLSHDELRTQTGYTFQKAKKSALIIGGVSFLLSLILYLLFLFD